MLIKIKSLLMNFKLYKIVICSLLFPLCVYAQEVKVDNVWYLLDSSRQSASIIRTDTAYRKPQLRIPTYVHYKGKKFKVVKVNSCAFHYNNYLQRIDLPNTVNSIDSFAFMKCSHLGTIRIRGNVTSIGTAAFGWCSSLKKIDLPTRITHIPELMCFYCSSLKKIKIPRGVMSIGDQAFEGCNSLIDIQLPKGLKSIGFNAFRNCRNLKRLLLPYSVDTLRSSSFAYCERLIYVRLGTIKRIQNSVFRGCEAISKITIASPTPPRMLILNEEEFPFDSCVFNAEVIIPCGSLKDYQMAEGWNIFSNFKEGGMLIH